MPASSSLVIYCCSSRMLVLLKCLKTLNISQRVKKATQNKKNESEGKTINTARVSCNPFEVGANQQFSALSSQEYPVESQIYNIIFLRVIQYPISFPFKSCHPHFSSKQELISFYFIADQNRWEEN